MGLIFPEQSAQIAGISQFRNAAFPPNGASWVPIAVGIVGAPWGNNSSLCCDFWIIKAGVAVSHLVGGEESTRVARARVRRDLEFRGTRLLPDGGKAMSAGVDRPYN